MLDLCSRNRVTAGSTDPLRALSPPVIIPKAHCVLGLHSSILLTPVLALLKSVSPGGLKTNKSDTGSPRLSVMVLVYFNANQWESLLACVYVLHSYRRPA